MADDPEWLLLTINVNGNMQIQNVVVGYTSTITTTTLNNRDDWQQYFFLERTDPMTRPNNFKLTIRRQTRAWEIRSIRIVMGDPTYLMRLNFLVINEQTIDNSIEFFYNNMPNFTLLFFICPSTQELISKSCFVNTGIIIAESNRSDDLDCNNTYILNSNLYEMVYSEYPSCDGNFMTYTPFLDDQWTDK